jgi:beta-glucosidase/6-phospho-beta-glucosidase/beta-galactosidase
VAETGAPAPLFRSFFQGGFEGSSHRRDDGRQLDLLAASRHEALAREDYALLRQSGVLTLRDALRWHRIEAEPGRYDWSSFQPMLEAAVAEGMEVIWDLCHYGLPHWLDVFSPDFVPRFAEFAARAAERVAAAGAPAWYCAVNEISFWSWAGGEKGFIYPYADCRAPELKRQLAAAAIAATRAIRAIDPRARFLSAEPLIHIVAHPDRPEDAPRVEQLRLAQFEAMDMLTGRLAPELGGAPELVDVVGLNFYCINQWVHEVETMVFGHRLYRPLADLLAEVHARYGKPMTLSETGAEGANGPGWLRLVAGELRTALRRGLPVEGCCLYPVMDYPGWSDERHCLCGLIRVEGGWGGRSLDAELLRQLEEERWLLARTGLARPAMAPAAAPDCVPLRLAGSAG